MKGPLGRYGGPSLRPLVTAAAVLVAVCGLVLFIPFGGRDDMTQVTGSPSDSDTYLPPPPTVALPTPGENTSLVTPTPSPRPLVATVSPTPSTVPPSTSPTVTPRAELPTPTPSENVSAVSYENCAEVRAAGVAPLYRGDPGYSLKLDRNGDGVACDRGSS